MSKELIELVFTSYRESMTMTGMKFSLDRHSPRLCSYPALGYMTMIMTRDLTMVNVQRVCSAVLDNNWNLIHNLIYDMHDLGIHRIIFCD